VCVCACVRVCVCACVCSPSLIHTAPPACRGGTLRRTRRIAAPHPGLPRARWGGEAHRFRTRRMAPAMIGSKSAVSLLLERSRACCECRCSPAAARLPPRTRKEPWFILPVSRPAIGGLVGALSATQRKAGARLRSRGNTFRGRGSRDAVLSCPWTQYSAPWLRGLRVRAAAGSQK